MTKLYQLGIIITLASLATASYAVDCNSLISKGLQKNVVNNSQGVSLADINSCMAQCDAIQSSGDPTKDSAAISQCTSSLSTLAFAVNYDNSISDLSPNSFAQDPGSLTSGTTLPVVQPTRSNESTATVNNTYQQTTTPQVQTSPTSSYIMNPKAAEKIKNAAKSKNAIRWF